MRAHSMAQEKLLVAEAAALRQRQDAVGSESGSESAASDVEAAGSGRKLGRRMAAQQAKQATLQAELEGARTLCKEQQETLDEATTLLQRCACNRV